MSYLKNITVNYREYLIEFMGTAILVFFAAGSVMVSSMLANTSGMIVCGVVSGLVLMMLIWSFGDKSGAHFNPALTFTLTLFREFPIERLFGYVICQMAGSAVAASLLYHTLGSVGDMGANIPNVVLGVSWNSALAIETCLSVIMMLIIRGSGFSNIEFQKFSSIPIGAIVGIEVMLMGPIAGAAMNPARAFGPYLYYGKWYFFGIYIIGPFVGLLCGGYLWKIFEHPIFQKK